ncbi:hypothetical protein [Yinghuangia sp. YIM S09857]|uniref:hypothetical protein n=1 Tax=Yinghuangia sp. YIM S09857 TaxID=3436929 RepID=UPI003F5325A6
MPGCASPVGREIPHAERVRRGRRWRGIFLTAAKELREGVVPAAFATAGPDTVQAMPLDILFDFAAVHLTGDESALQTLASLLDDFDPNVPLVTP